MAPTSTLVPLYFLLLGLAVLPYAEGHAHNETMIPAGEAVSEDPIVRPRNHIPKSRRMGCRSSWKLMSAIGYDTMGAYVYSDSCLGCRLSLWDGTWSKHIQNTFIYT